MDISSLIDTWLLLRDIELGGERNRGLYILKSRGMAHSNQIREFLLTDRGIDLCDVYLGPEGVLTGSARRTQEARERAAALARQQDMERRRSDLERKRRALEAKVAALKMEFEIEEDEVNYVLAQERRARSGWCMTGPKWPAAARPMAPSPDLVPAPRKEGKGGADENAP